MALFRLGFVFLNLLELRLVCIDERIAQNRDQRVPITYFWILEIAASRDPGDKLVGALIFEDGDHGTRQPLPRAAIRRLEITKSAPSACRDSPGRRLARFGSHAAA